MAIFLILLVGYGTILGIVGKCFGYEAVPFAVKGVVFTLLFLCAVTFIGLIVTLL